MERFLTRDISCHETRQCCSEHASGTQRRVNEGGGRLARNEDGRLIWRRPGWSRALQVAAASFILSRTASLSHLIFISDTTDPTRKTDNTLDMTTDKLSHTRHSSDPDYMDSQSRPPLTPTHSKPRRPLPVPGEQQQQQQHQPKAIPASFFYGNENKSASPHSSSLGSSHTNYIAPSTSHHNSWKEPEPAMDDDAVPPLVPVEQWGTNPDLNWGTGDWDPNPPSGAWGSPNVVIDGRSEEEEVDWCDVEVRERHNRPGPGLLPPFLADLLHNPDHTLYFVKPSPPLPRQASSSPSSVPAPATLHFVPPTAEEVRMAVPHPNAYYCKEHNGWVLLQWCSSTILPAFAKSFTSLHPLPDQTRRKRSASCLDGGEQQYGRVNKTHHFHRYEKAVDARCLTIPYKRSEWEVDDQKKLKHRKATLIDIDAEPESEASMQGEREPDEPEGDLLDLYVCCQCSTYCLVSEVLPGVIPFRYVDEFTRDKLSHPALDKTPKATVLAGWETVLTYVVLIQLLGEALIFCHQDCGEPTLERRNTGAPCH